MLKVGYKLMSEEHGAADLVRNAKQAEQAGFDFAAIWLEGQGHAPFVWSVLGAVANATERLGLMTAVTCPIMRYHAAIIEPRPHWCSSARTGSLSGRENASTNMSWVQVGRACSSATSASRKPPTLSPHRQVEQLSGKTSSAGPRTPV